uniref:Uncharacterized protein n=1 Tax=Manihot esculenta TaxID=3983 RepID=A0A2C9U9I0_MANES
MDFLLCFLQKNFDSHINLNMSKGMKEQEYATKTPPVKNYHLSRLFFYGPRLISLSASRTSSGLQEPNGIQLINQSTSFI